MDTATLIEREKEWEKKYPHMFTHPELNAGEVWAKDVVIDALDPTISLYKSKGVQSTRAGKKFLKDACGHSNIAHYPIFMNLRELIRANDKFEKENPAT